MGISKEADNIRNKMPFNALYPRELKISDVLFKIFAQNTYTRRTWIFVLWDITAVLLDLNSLCFLAVVNFSQNPKDMAGAMAKMAGSMSHLNRIKQTPRLLMSAVSGLKYVFDCLYESYWIFTNQYFWVSVKSHSISISIIRLFALPIPYDILYQFAPFCKGGRPRMSTGVLGHKVNLHRGESLGHHESNPVSQKFMTKQIKNLSSQAHF